MRELMYSLAFSVSAGVAAVVIISDVQRDMEAKVAAFRRDTEVAVRELVDARGRDVEAVNAANARLWAAVTNDVPKGVAKNLSQAVADRLARCEDKAIEALDRRIRNMEERYGRRAR